MFQRHTTSRHPQLRALARVQGLAATLGAVLALCAPLESHAQTCSALRSNLRDSKDELAVTLARNPITSVVFGGCIVGASAEFDRTGNAGGAFGQYLACAGFTCMLANNPGECADVHRRLFVSALTISSLERRIGERC